MKKTNAKFIIKLSLSFFLVIGILFGAYFVFRHLGITEISREKLQEYIRKRASSLR